MATQIFFISNPDPWGKDSHFDSYFFRWVGSTTNQLVIGVITPFIGAHRCMTIIRWLSKLPPRDDAFTVSWTPGLAYERHVQDANHAWGRLNHCPYHPWYGIFTCIWLEFVVNVGKYTIHGFYGLVTLEKKQLRMFLLTFLMTLGMKSHVSLLARF